MVKKLIIYANIIYALFFLMALESLVTLRCWLILAIMFLVEIILVLLWLKFITLRDVVKASKDNWLNKLLDN